MASIGGFTRREPKSAKSRRAVKKMESKVVENAKKALMLLGSSTNDIVKSALADLMQLLKPNVKQLKKRNAFHPFEAPQHLEFLGFKNDCSLFAFGSDSKKRPNNLVIGRHFDFHVLDMVELGIIAQDRISGTAAAGLNVCSLGSKPMFVFEGSEFDSDPYFVRIKNLLVDYFGGSVGEEITLQGVDRVIAVSLRSKNGTDSVVAPSDDCRGTKPVTQPGNAILRFRHYGLVKGTSVLAVARSASKVRLVDVGPNFDFELRRTFFSPGPDFSRACRVPRQVLARLRSLHENVSGDAMGNLRGQVHVGRQDVNEIQLRRFKARKGKRGQAAEAGAEAAADGENDGAAAPQRKRRRKAEEDWGGPETDI